MFRHLRNRDAKILVKKLKKFSRYNRYVYDKVEKFIEKNDTFNYFIIATNENIENYCRYVIIHDNQYIKQLYNTSIYYSSLNLKFFLDNNLEYKKYIKVEQKYNYSNFLPQTEKFLRNYTEMTTGKFTKGYYNIDPEITDDLQKTVDVKNLSVLFRGLEWNEINSEYLFDDEFTINNNNNLIKFADAMAQSNLYNVGESFTINLPEISSWTADECLAYKFAKTRNGLWYNIKNDS